MDGLPTQSVPAGGLNQAASTTADRLISGCRPSKEATGYRAATDNQTSFSAVFGIVYKDGAAQAPPHRRRLVRAAPRRRSRGFCRPIPVGPVRHRRRPSRDPGRLLSAGRSRQAANRHPPAHRPAHPRPGHHRRAVTRDASAGGASRCGATRCIRKRGGYRSGRRGIRQ